MRTWTLMLTVLIVAVLAYGGLCALLYVSQRRIIYPAPSRTPTWGEPLGFARFVEVKTGAPVVVHFHGNGESVADLGWAAEFWRERNVSFYAVEYPGYGGMPGEPTEDSIYATAQSALDRLLETGVARDQVVLIGQSLGTGVAVEMARRGYGTRLVLLAPFTSLGDVAQAAFPFVPARWLVRDRFDSASKAAAVPIPVLVIHGEHDEVVPYGLGRQLASLFPAGQLLTVSRGTHNDLWRDSNVRSRVTHFVLGP